MNWQNLFLHAGQKQMLSVLGSIFWKILGHFSVHMWRLRRRKLGTLINFMIIYCDGQLFFILNITLNFLGLFPPFSFSILLFVCFIIQARVYKDGYCLFSNFTFESTELEKHEEYFTNLVTHLLSTYEVHSKFLQCIGMVRSIF